MPSSAFHGEKVVTMAQVVALEEAGTSSSSPPALYDTSISTAESHNSRTRSHEGLHYKATVSMNRNEQHRAMSDTGVGGNGPLSDSHSYAGSAPVHSMAESAAHLSSLAYRRGADRTYGTPVRRQRPVGSSDLSRRTYGSVARDDNLGGNEETGNEVNQERRDRRLSVAERIRMLNDSFPDPELSMEEDDAVETKPLQPFQQPSTLPRPTSSGWQKKSDQAQSLEESSKKPSNFQRIMSARDKTANRTMKETTSEENTSASILQRHSKLQERIAARIANSEAVATPPSQSAQPVTPEPENRRQHVQNSQPIHSKVHTVSPEQEESQSAQRQSNQRLSLRTKLVPMPLQQPRVLQQSHSESSFNNQRRLSSRLGTRPSLLVSSPSADNIPTHSESVVSTNTPSEANDDSFDRQVTTSSVPLVRRRRPLQVPAPDSTGVPQVSAEVSHNAPRNNEDSSAEALQQKLWGKLQRPNPLKDDAELDRQRMSRSLSPQRISRIVSQSTPPRLSQKEMQPTPPRVTNLAREPNKVFKSKFYEAALAAHRGDPQHSLSLDEAKRLTDPSYVPRFTADHTSISSRQFQTSSDVLRPATPSRHSIATERGSEIIGALPRQHLHDRIQRQKSLSPLRVRAFSKDESTEANRSVMRNVSYSSDRESEVLGAMPRVYSSEHLMPRGSGSPLRRSRLQSKDNDAESVARLVAKLTAVNRDDPEAALAKIDSILRAEGIHRGESLQEHKGEKDDESDDETSVSSMTNPTYQSKSPTSDQIHDVPAVPMMSRVATGRPRPSALQSYTTPNVTFPTPNFATSARKSRSKQQKPGVLPPFEIQVTNTAVSSSKNFDANLKKTKPTGKATVQPEVTTTFSPSLAHEIQKANSMLEFQKSDDFGFPIVEDANSNEAVSKRETDPPATLGVPPQVDGDEANHALAKKEGKLDNFMLKKMTEKQEKQSAMAGEILARKIQTWDELSNPTEKLSANLDDAPIAPPSATASTTSKRSNVGLKVNPRDTSMENAVGVELEVYSQSQASPARQLRRDRVQKAMNNLKQARMDAFGNTPNVWDSTPAPNDMTNENEASWVSLPSNPYFSDRPKAKSRTSTPKPNQHFLPSDVRNAFANVQFNDGLEQLHATTVNKDGVEVAIIEEIESKQKDDVTPPRAMPLLPANPIEATAPRNRRGFFSRRKEKSTDQTHLLVPDSSGEDENILRGRETGRQDPADRSRSLEDGRTISQRFGRLLKSRNEESRMGHV